ncbi:MAG: 3-hydroxybutyryl-CoA dehydrogenase [candidate division Zixibacteria bacterium]|nr:3-hydroxybutyryl-CoA dehydrogenase [candidate division Zixibacteria bacterium]
MPSTKIMIIGAGRMGQGLAEAIATEGTDVTLMDLTTRLAERGIKGISESMNREIEKWGLTESDKKAILARIFPSSDLSLADEAEIVIEAIPEKLNLKRDLFQKLDTICPDDCLIITNTGTISVSEIAEATQRPEKIIGMHFLNPVTKVPLVEIVRGLKTDEETFQKAVEFASILGKGYISVNEYPGYVTTRIIVPMLNEAMHVLMEGVATAEDIDRAMKLGFGFNVGPLTMADQTGLDVVMSWMQNLIDELSDHKYNPCPLLRKMVRAGHLGVKTGSGFFKYDKDGNKIRHNHEVISAQVKA